LALIDTPCPAIGFKEQDVLNDAEDLARLFLSEMDFAAESIRHMGVDELMPYVVEKVKAFGRVPPDFQLSQAIRLVEVRKSLRRSLTKYRCERYPGKMTLLRAKDSRPTDKWYSPDPAFGWSEFITKGIDVKLVPGDHLTILQSPQVQVTARCLQACIEGGG
jgi:thioesterase domain-containing protein